MRAENSSLSGQNKSFHIGYVPEPIFAHFCRKMYDLKKGKKTKGIFRKKRLPLISRADIYINEKVGTLCSVKMWKHEDGVDSTGELINN